MNPRDKAIEIVTALEKEIDEKDIYWNATDDAKKYSKVCIDIVSDNSSYWMDVKSEIDKLPTYVQDLNT